MHRNALAERGLTLIELMIVVAVIAIITAVAYPTYQDHVRKARRAEGKTALLKALQLEERAYTSNGTYTIDLVPLFGAAAFPVKSGENPGTGNYELEAAADPDTGSDLRQGVRITATPTGTYTDPECGVLSVTTTGVRGATGSKGPAFCWER